VALLLADEFLFDLALFLFKLLDVFPRVALLFSQLLGEVELFTLEGHAVFSFHVGYVGVCRAATGGNGTESRTTGPPPASTT
jgi:hypothetical protein